MTNTDYVDLSRNAAVTVAYLDFETRIKFVEAVRQCASIKDVPEPYRGWIKNPESVPNKNRSQRFKTAPQDKAIKSDGYVANTGMKTAAQRAIDWREQGHKGGTQIGATRARQIVSGEHMSADTVKRMFSFFSRHEVDKKATGFNSGEDGYPSPGRVAWDLWGGDAGFSWSRNIVDSLDVE